MNHLTKRVANLLVVLCLISAAWHLSAEEPASTPPDLTHGGKRDKNHDYLIGPTGARGWMFCRREDLTATSRQILITAVEKGSPADGVLQIKDVILGVGDTPFADDARKSFGRAITAAEEKSGVLRLIRWRNGTSATVDLKLAVLGSYSDTAPYDCPKSQKIFEQGCQFIAKKGFDFELTDDNAIPSDINALALLASGKEEYRPMLAAYTKKVAASLHPDVWTWFYGNGNIFLAEYVLATGDKSILPELKRTTMEVALGQSAVGTWGHGFSMPNGNLGGYGCMNQPGIPVTIGLELARQAGVNDRALDRAIEKSAKFLRYYVNKGAIPYGDHQPGVNVHEDNGKTSCAAVLFDLLCDREATAFYSRMATAAYDDREHGHCGIVWSYLWALPGVSRCGPLATGAYMKEQAWYYDLSRTWKGNFVYQRQPGEEGNDDEYIEWDVTGAYLLTYGLPLKSLYVTGKRRSEVPALDAEEVKDVITAGRDVFPANGKNGYESRSTEALFAGLSSWSPAMRFRSAQALSKREGDFIPALLKMLASSDRYARYGACEALSCLGARGDAAAPNVRALFVDPDPWLQSLACKAIGGLGKDARKASVNDLLALAVRKNPDDPRGMTQRAVANVLFEPYPGTDGPPGILAESLKGVDRTLLYPAIQSILKNDDGAARLTLEHFYNKLSASDVARLLPSIVEAIEKMAPSDEMFADGIRLAGLNLLSRLHIREGIQLCVSVMEVERWNEEERSIECLKYLQRYGKRASIVVPQLKDIRSKLIKDNPDSKLIKILDKNLSQINTSKAAPTLVDLKEFIEHASTNREASKKKE
ncbi:MAG: DUF6288 domain-containing protein [Planctomycetota bacterium]